MKKLMDFRWVITGAVTASIIFYCGWSLGKKQSFEIGQSPKIEQYQPGKPVVFVIGTVVEVTSPSEFLVRQGSGPPSFEISMQEPHDWVDGYLMHANAQQVENYSYIATDGSKHTVKGYIEVPANVPLTMQN